MKKKWIIILGICAVFFLTACKKDYSESQKINDILDREDYVAIILGDGYLQQEVRFEMKEDRAVVPVNAKWGLPKYREGETVGVSYGEEGGVDIYDADPGVNPELYLESYLDSVRSLNLTVRDIKDSGFSVKIVQKEQLSVFAEELVHMSGMVFKDSYELAGVNIQFDDKCRPVRKEFQLQKKDKTKLDDEEKDSAKCTQKFSYDIGKIKFGWAFNKVKKEIEKEY